VANDDASTCGFADFSSKWRSLWQQKHPWHKRFRAAPPSRVTSARPSPSVGDNNTATVTGNNNLTAHAGDGSNNTATITGNFTGADAGSFSGVNNDNNTAIATNNGTLNGGTLTASAGTGGDNNTDNNATFTNNGTINNADINDTVTVAAGSGGDNNTDNSATVTNTNTGTINGPITLGAGNGSDQTGQSNNIENNGTIG
jgi:hypothetical protein